MMKTNYFFSFREACKGSLFLEQRRGWRFAQSLLMALACLMMLIQVASVCSSNWLSLFTHAVIITTFAIVNKTEVIIDVPAVSTEETES